MSQVGAREPGIAGAVLPADGLFAGIIADGIHAQFAKVGFAYNLLRDRLCPLSLSMSRA